MEIDLKGKIRNTNIPKNKPLLPFLEAISNSIHALDENSEKNPKIIFNLYRERLSQSFLPNQNNHNRFVEFEIIDNGIGFNDANYNSFIKSDTTHKEALGAKGVGRFLWLKAFELIKIESKYTNDKEYYSRDFDFKISSTGIENHQNKKLNISDNKKNKAKTVIKFINIRPEYLKLIPKDFNSICIHVLEHFLMYLILDKCPEIIINDIENKYSASIKTLFENQIGKDVEIKDFEIKKNIFQLYLIKTRDSVNNKELFLCAHNREVARIKLIEYIPNLKERLYDKTKEIFFTSYLLGDYLNKIVNNDRSELNFLNANDVFFDHNEDITKDEIIVEVKKIILEYLNQYIESINEKKTPESKTINRKRSTPI